MHSKILLLLGAVNAFVGVGCGAFGAHGLKRRLPGNLIAVWETAVQYHLWHALGLIAVGLTLAVTADSLLRLSGWLMFSGIVVFSGSLYLLALSGVRWLGAITPLGGLLFLAAWAVYAWAVWRSV